MNGFVSYCHDDYRLFCEAQKHLAAIERAFSFSFWTDTRINVGYHWSSVVEDAINRANVFVLLISPSFIKSDYINDKEIPAIQARCARTSALVLPTVLQRCAWAMVAGALQVTPTVKGKVKPIVDWPR